MWIGVCVKNECFVVLRLACACCFACLVVDLCISGQGSSLFFFFFFLHAKRGNERGLGTEMDAKGTRAERPELSSSLVQSSLQFLDNT